MGRARRTVRAVLFDMDGVLLDSFEAWLATVQDACRHFGAPVVDRETFKTVFGAGSDTDVATFLRGAATPGEADRFYHEAFPRYIPLIRAVPEAPRVLRSLRLTGIRTACVTNTTRPLARALLDRNDLLGEIESLVTADDVARPKPAPDMVTKALADLATPPPAGLLVGDTIYDIEAARAAGCTAVGLMRDGGHHRIDRLEEVLTLVSDG